MSLEAILAAIQADGAAALADLEASTAVQIQAIQQDDRYLSPELSEMLLQTPGLDIDQYDLVLLKSLADGYSQQEISKRFKKQAISPHSLSSIEKRVNRLKESLSARNIPNLIALAKDMGLI